MSKRLTIGLFGFGVVGQGLHDIISTKDLNIEIRKIAIKNPDKVRSLPKTLFTTDANIILNDPEINTIIELINDADAAYEIVTRALKCGKNVVSANKKMIAEHLDELVELNVGEKTQYINIAPGVKELSITPRTDALKNLGLSDDGRPIIGWIARVTGVKNPMRALDVARAIPTAHFVMAGGGDLLQEIKEAAPSNVSVIGWAKAEDLFGASDLILSTSENEGMPIALIEAQLAGKPVVATDVGGVSEVIANHETGLVTNKNAGSIAAALNSLILDTQKRTQMSTLATSRARALFSIDQMVNAHVSLYKSIVN